MTLLLIYALCDALATCTRHGPEGGQGNCATPCRFSARLLPPAEIITEILESSNARTFNHQNVFRGLLRAKKIASTTSCPFSEPFSNKAASPCRLRASGIKFDPTLRERLWSKTPSTAPTAEDADLRGKQAPLASVVLNHESNMLDCCGLDCTPAADEASTFDLRNFVRKQPSQQQNQCVKFSARLGRIFFQRKQ